MCVLQSLIHQIKGVKKIKKKEELVDIYLILRMVYLRRRVFLLIYFEWRVFLLLTKRSRVGSKNKIECRSVSSSTR